jgi:hypothetical protein
MVFDVPTDKEATEVEAKDAGKASDGAKAVASAKSSG